MVKRQTALKIRKTHRYLGLFIGIQFLMWTISGLYFSWTDIDEIHGDQFRRETVTLEKFQDLKSPSDVYNAAGITSVELKDIAGIPHYWLNGSKLVNAKTGEERSEISQKEAKIIAKQNMRDDLKVSSVERITEVGDHHEYRGSPLPAYVISYDSPENIRAYVASNNGAFRSVRHRDWRWFDFLWMTHTMDYEGRDDFNNLILRAFSLLGLITVLSGFTLWYTSSPTIRKVFNKKKKKKKNEKKI
ncbi:PepSY-associated transmembrane protein [Gillisia sp. Hel_I_86]|uniref:PepSY domain-containing protein n=1 Tax=Gillisia sp. Hel_I_86 TaxID=1249981 RepID=UPI00119AC334|nr:PepSY domain-containing protein [Gillisia sp. Hel_I_86]TVZ26856.1 PepSY-associated transmembrane protein [Gillisia sp. Hel_I_86]